MTIKTIKLGAQPNDGTGDPLRNGGQIINDNFAELDQRTSAAQQTGSQAGDAAAQAQSAANKALQDKVDKNTRGVAGGVATLNAQTKIPLEQLSTVLKALSTLIPAADFMPYFNGVDSAALAALTPFARILLAQANYTDALATLGLRVSTGPQERIDGRVMLTGQFGIGGDAPVFNGDIDGTACPLGKCFITVNGTGTKPPGITYGILETVRAAGNQGIIQTLWEITGAGGTLRTFERFQYNTLAWGPWRMVYKANNIVGPMNADPNAGGGLFESGSNANGLYVKYIDGTAMCWNSYSPATPQIAANNLATQVNVALPISFIDSGYTLMASISPSASNDHYGVTNAFPVNQSTGGIIIRNGGTAQTFGVRFVGMGRWRA